MWLSQSEYQLFAKQQIRLLVYNVLVGQYVFVIVIQNPQKGRSVQVVLQVLYPVAFTQPEELFKVETSLGPIFVVLVGVEPFEVLCFQVHWVAAEKHVDDELGNVGALLLVGLLLVIRLVDHVLDVVPVFAQEIFGLEYLFGFGVVFLGFGGVDIDYILGGFEMIGLVLFLHLFWFLLEQFLDIL